MASGVVAGRGRPGFLVVATLAGLELGCAHDLPGWKLAATEHFQVYTDRPRRTYEPVVERLEEVHAGLASAFFEGDIPPMQVFIFGGSEFEELAGKNIGGLFVSPGQDQGGVMVLPEVWDTNYLDQTAAHELTHAFLNARYPGVPLWFHEGFANYCESIMVQEERVWFGSKMGVDPGAAYGRLVPVAELFSARYAGFHGDLETRHYTTAWAVIHYLWHGEKKSLRPRFGQFRDTMLAGSDGPDRSARAWQQVFPELPLGEVDGHLRDHLTAAFALPRSQLVGFKLIRPPVPPLKLTPADPAFVDRVRDLLRDLRKRREGATASAAH